MTTRILTMNVNYRCPKENSVMQTDSLLLQEKMKTHVDLHQRNFQTK